GDAITADEAQTGRQHAANVRELLDGPDHDAKALKTATQLLDDATQTLAVLLLDRAMEESLARRGIL
ncbi:MAG: hypothetical protein ACKO8Z_14160, partial [Prosthecobacter sp.]